MDAIQPSPARHQKLPSAGYLWHQCCPSWHLCPLPHNAGYRGSAGYSGETHFNVEVVSSRFEGLTSIKRHRLVYQILEAEMRRCGWRGGCLCFTGCCQILEAEMHRLGGESEWVAWLALVRFACLAVMVAVCRRLGVATARMRGMLPTCSF